PPAAQRVEPRGDGARAAGASLLLAPGGESAGAAVDDDGRDDARGHGAKLCRANPPAASSFLAERRHARVHLRLLGVGAVIVAEEVAQAVRPQEEHLVFERATALLPRRGLERDDDVAELPRVEGAPDALAHRERQDVGRLVLLAVVAIER